MDRQYELIGDKVASALIVAFRLTMLTLVQFAISPDIKGADHNYIFALPRRLSSMRALGFEPL